MSINHFKIATLKLLFAKMALLLTVVAKTAMEAKMG